MNKEQIYFLSIIKDYIFECESEANSNINWRVILDYSNSHQLTAIVYHQCKNYISSDVSKTFKDVSLATVYSNVKRRRITDSIFNVLTEEKIKHFLIKGFVIADFYPNWQHRTMGDTDVVVDNIEKAHVVLLDSGFQNTLKVKDNAYHYSYNNQTFELHDRLVYEEAINLDSTTEFLNDYNAYVSNGKLDDSFHFVFVLSHLRRHFMNSGVGFRQFVDVAVLIKNDDKINWIWTENKLKEIGLLPFAKTVFYYIERWFGVKAPIEAENVSEDVFEASTIYVFCNGVFGFNNEVNKDFLASNTVRKAKNQKLAMLKYAVQKVFPSYKAMVASERYSFLMGKPILLPAAWVYRMVNGVHRKGLNEGRNQISKSFVSKEYISKREEMFRNWGLE